MNYTVKNNTVLVVVDNVGKEYNLDKLDTLKLTFFSDHGTHGAVYVKETESREDTFKLKSAPAAVNPYTPLPSPFVLTYEMLLNAGWTPQQVADSTYKDLMPEEAIIDLLSTDLVELLNKTQGSNFNYAEMKKEAQEEEAQKKEAELEDDSSVETPEREAEVRHRGKVKEQPIDRAASSRTDFAKGKHVLTVLSAQRIATVIINYRKGGCIKTLSSEINVKPGTLYYWASTVNRLIKGLPVSVGRSRLRAVANEIKANRLSEFHNFTRC